MVLRVVVHCFGSIIEDCFFLPGTSIRVGAKKRNQIRVPMSGLPERHKILTYRLDGSIDLLIRRECSGVVQAGDRLERLQDLTRSGPKAFQKVSLRAGTKGVLEIGNCLLYFEEIAEPKRGPEVRRRERFSDRYFRPWIVFSLVTHLLILMLMRFLPNTPHRPEFPLRIIENKNITMVDRPVKFAPPKVVQIERKSAMKGVPEEGEGKRRVRTAPPKKKVIPGPTHVAKAKPKVAKAKPKKRKAVRQTQKRASTKNVGKKRSRGKKRVTRRGPSRKKVRNAGVLGALGSAGGSNSFQNLIGESSATGSVENFLGSEDGGRGRSERSVRSGKGVGRGSADLEGMSTSVQSGLGKKGFGKGRKGAGLAQIGKGRKGVVVATTLDKEEILVTGTLPKKEIAKTIGNHVARIQFCYEKQLQKQPYIKGRIVTDFLIDVNGKVKKARVKKSTMNNAVVEQCVLNVVRSLRFPKPGGGIVQVIYPFLFKITG